MSTQAATPAAAEVSEGLPLPAPNVAPAQPNGMPAQPYGIPAQPDPLSMGAVLRLVPMRRLWFAQIVSVLGDFLALFAVIEVITFNLHGNARQVTQLQIAYLLPIAVLGVVSGVFVDRWPIKPTLVASDLLRAALCLLLLSVHSIAGFYVVMACISIVSSFFSPAQGVAIRSVVPLHGLRSANALMQQAFFIMRIVGPFAAGALVGLTGARVCYWADSCSFVASAMLIASIPLLAANKRGAPDASAASAASAGPANAPQTGLRKIFTDMREGGSFIIHHAALLFVIVSLAAAMFVMGCFGPLIAVYVRDDLHAAIKVFTIGSMLIGVGLLLGVNALNVLARRISNATQVYGGLLGIATGTLLMATLPRNLTLFGGCLLIGVACAGIIVPSQTLIQGETPPALLGRVGSTVMSCIFSAQIAGLLLSGVLASLTSVRRVFALCTVMLLVLALAGKLWMEPQPKAATAAA